MLLMHLTEVRPRKDKRGFDLISDVLPFGRLWYGEPNAASNAVGYAQFHSRSRSHVANSIVNVDHIIMRIPVPVVFCAKGD